MHVKFSLTVKEHRRMIQQARLIDQNLNDDSVMSVTIDDNRIAIDVPNMARSLQRQIAVDRSMDEIGLLISEPAPTHEAH